MLQLSEQREAAMQDVDILRSVPQNGGRPGNPRFNGANYFQNTVYLAGQIAADTRAPGGDTYYGQTKQVLGQVEELLARSGSSMQRILQVGSALNMANGCEDVWVYKHHQFLELKRS